MIAYWPGWGASIDSVSSPSPQGKMARASLTGPLRLVTVALQGFPDLCHKVWLTVAFTTLLYNSSSSGEEIYLVASANLQYK